MKLIAILYVVINTGPAQIHTIEIPGVYANCQDALQKSKPTFIPSTYPGGPTATELRLGFLCVPAQ